VSTYRTEEQLIEWKSFQESRKAVPVMDEPIQVSSLYCNIPDNNLQLEVWISDEKNETLLQTFELEEGLKLISLDIEKLFWFYTDVERGQMLAVGKYTLDYFQPIVLVLKKGETIIEKKYFTSGF